MGGSPEIHREFRRIFLAAPGAEVASAITPVAPVPTAGAFAVDSADHGAEAAEKVMQSRADDRPYAVAFIEVGMASGSDALSTVEMLWRADPALQIVVCTAGADAAWDTLGIKDHLVILKQPFGKTEVLLLAHAMARKWHATEDANLRQATLEKMFATRMQELETRNAELRRSEERFAPARFPLSSRPSAKTASWMPTMRFCK